MKKVNCDIQKQIVNDYEKNVSNKTLTEKYSLHRSTIQAILLKNGIKLRPLSVTSRKYKINDENYFNVINTEEKAYILGLLYADGNIRYNGFEITLMEIDKEILEKLSIIIYGKIILGYRKARKYKNEFENICKPQYRLVVSSNIMKNDLIKHGCVQAKTFKIRFPKLDNDELYKHFIRGYFDGDGCFSASKTRPNVASIQITSNTNFCNELAEYVKNKINLNMKSVIRYGNVGSAQLSNFKQVIIFMNWLYDNSTIYLTRKYDKFKKFKLNSNFCNLFNKIYV